MVWRYTRTGCCPRRESIISLLGRLLRAGTVRLALRWGHGTSRLLLGIPRPHPVDAARGGVDRSRFLDRRREEGEAPRRPHGRSLRPPGVQALRTRLRGDPTGEAFARLAFKLCTQRTEDLESR